MSPSVKSEKSKARLNLNFVTARQAVKPFVALTRGGTGLLLLEPGTSLNLTNTLSSL